MNPTRDHNGVPCHSDLCPEFDGKRCRAMGFRPDRFCEPMLAEEYILWRNLLEESRRQIRQMATDHGCGFPCELIDAIGKALGESE